MPKCMKEGTSYLFGGCINSPAAIHTVGYSYSYRKNIRSYPGRLFIRQPFCMALET